MPSRMKYWTLAGMIATVLGLSFISMRESFAQDPAPAAAPAPAEAAPAAPEAPADKTATPTKADSTGASYTGASTTAALTKDGDKVTDGTIAQDVKLLKVSLNIFWTLMCGFLVMFMQAGFALVETGLTRAKNVGHTMAMNFVVYAVGMLGFYICGFALAFGNYGAIGLFDGPAILTSPVSIELFGKTFEILGTKGFFLLGDTNDATVLTLFLFQMVFMDTTATIPTGAMAERWKFSSFIIFGFFLSMFLYPVYANWVWGGGWLADLGANFGLGNGHLDFAGSSAVHMTGGVTALAGALIIGPRVGKFNKDGSANAIPGHNIAMVVLGTLILAFGWFGFNAGSTLGATDLRISSIAVCTMLATAAGCLTSLFYMWVVFGKPDPTMGCNGLLAGAVAITAPCAFVDPLASVIIGGVAGILVIWSVLFVEKILKVDDPVGAVSVHGVCGAFGCICLGLFANGEYGGGLNGVAAAPLGLFYGGGLGQLAAQTIGVAANILWVFPVAFLFFFIVEKTIGNRTDYRAEVEGLDIPEMGVLGYINEDTQAVQLAGQEKIASIEAAATPPRTTSSYAPSESGVPAGRS
ncbi:MAG: ammonium transporter [Isosphaeraceae bacterium]|nr:ammonium transporter [Isosphaeraceae bacterium]